MRQTDSSFNARKRSTRMALRRRALWGVIIPAPSTGKQEDPT